MADPDGLLLEEALLGAIRERGFEPITFEDHAGEKGLYRGAVRLAVDGGPPLALWTARAMLSTTSDGPRPVPTLLRGPRLFPFDIAPPPTSELEACESLELTRHGLDHEARLGLAPGRGWFGIDLVSEIKSISYVLRKCLDPKPPSIEEALRDQCRHATGCSQ